MQTKGLLTVRKEQKRPREGRAAPPRFPRKMRKRARSQFIQVGRASGQAFRKRRALVVAPRRAARVPSGELKFFDVTHAAATIAAAGAIAEDSLCEIAQGIDENERVGRKCTLKAVHLKGSINLNSTTDLTDSGTRCRVLIYQDKQANGATAAVLDVLQTASVDSFRNLANVGRFTILYDKRFTLFSFSAAGDGTTNATNERSILIQLYKKCNIPLEFSAAAGAVTSLRSNNIGVLVVASKAAPIVSLGFVSRLRFTDN